MDDKQRIAEAFSFWLSMMACMAAVWAFGEVLTVREWHPWIKVLMEIGIYCALFTGLVAGARGIIAFAPLLWSKSGPSPQRRQSDDDLTA